MAGIMYGMSNQRWKQNSARLHNSYHIRSP